ncbi:hypothetical protein [Hydrogenophaga sp.]|uniref:hypothetical protein n=1 Tax=Hydrogenophaga sp. TaxID=1904254 RepID=UPI0026052028|nr:hypothetical protein [Hydrogenophaga sp.]MDM7948064.1 hypothetical protein [Hydrogenophaga sp.]
MKLYGTPPTLAVRALWLINELEIDCEIVEVDFGVGEHKGEAVRTINPILDSFASYASRLPASD